MSVQNQFSIRFLEPEVKDSLKQAFDEVEQKLGIDGLGTALFTVVMELVTNAVKANLKRAFFTKHGYSMKDAESYKSGVDAFKENYNVIEGEEYQRALGELDLVVSVNIDLDNDRLLTFVENNSMLQDDEETRIRGKLASAMSANELVDFYLHYGDDSEGSGLGLAMIVFLMREIGFDPDNFRVYQKNGKTIARIEFPLNKDYVPIRSRFQK